VERPATEGVHGAVHGAFAEGFHGPVGHKYEVVGVICLGVAEGEGEGLGSKDDVAVGEEEPVRLGEGGGGCQGVGLAEPTCGQVGDVEDLQRVGRGGCGEVGGEVVHEGAGLVGGAVVDGDDLEADAGGPEQRTEGGLDGGLLVAGGDDDGELGLVVVGWQGPGGGEAREVGQCGSEAEPLEGLPEPAEGEEPGGGEECPVGEVGRGHGFSIACWSGGDLRG